MQRICFFAILLSLTSSAATLTISAAISLKPAFEEIRKAYEVDSPNKIIFNFGASGGLAQQIANGAPIDIFLSASPKQVEELEHKKLLLPNSIKILLRNSLVLVTPLTAATITKWEDLSKTNVKKIAIGNPKTVPAGQYSYEFFERKNLIQTIQPKLILVENVRQVLTYVELGEVDAGVVYQTDALSSRKVKEVIKMDPLLHSPILYPLAIVKESRSLEAARHLAKYLQNKKAKAIFQKFGFTVDPDVI